jgi:rare lipoprotein A
MTTTLRLLAAASFLALATPAYADSDQSWVQQAFKPTSGGSRTTSLGTSLSGGGFGGGGEQGIASYYWQPQPVASGGRFNPNALTAAHKTLPFGTRVRVTDLSNGRSVVVTINDRGPYIQGRVIDLSRRAAQDIGMTGKGLARVRVERI